LCAFPCPASGQYARPVLAFAPPGHEVVDLLELVTEYGLLAVLGALVGAAIGYFTHDEARVEWTLLGATVGAIAVVGVFSYLVGTP
jgi:Flp pilus assembly pilin Flp